MLISNENNVEREQYTTGRSLSHQFLYADGEERVAESVGLDNGREYSGVALSQQPFSQMNGSVDASGYQFASESPVYSLDLSDLFPFLKVHQLSLFMIDQDVTIELTLTQQSVNRVCVKDADEGLTKNYTIDRNELNSVQIISSGVMVMIWRNIRKLTANRHLVL